MTRTLRADQRTEATAMEPAGQGETSVVIEGASKRFRTPEGQELVALDDINLTVGKQEFVAIVGPSGCGKTTLLRILAGLDTQSDGVVTVEGAPPGTGSSGFVFQKSALFPWRTVRRNVSFAVDLAATRRSDPELQNASVRRDRVETMLDLVDLQQFAKYYPHQISGGMQQRVNLARALAVRPPVLLMDEPFSALDAQTREKLQRDLLGVISEVGTSTVFITHDIREAVYLADRVVLLSPRPGRIVETYAIDQPRPRDAAFQQSDTVTEIAREIWLRLHAIEEEARDTAATEPPATESSATGG